MPDTLKTDYVDDVLDTEVNESRVYDIVDAQGNVVASNVHLEERTVYTQNGDKYGAVQINEQNTFINGLKTSFSQALTDLKATAIAQAVGAAASDTFAQVITKLGAIVNRGKVTKTLGLGQSYTIPQGYHNGQGTVSVSVTSQEKTITASRSQQVVTPDSGKVLSKVTVNKYPDASGTYGTVTSNGTHDMGASNNYRYVSVNVPIALTTRRLTTANTWITTQNVGYSSTVDTGSLRQHGFCANLRVGDPWADWTVSGTLYIQGSTNNSTWTNLTSSTFSLNYGAMAQKELSATGNYRYFRVAVASTHWRENHNVAFDELVIAFT